MLRLALPRQQVEGLLQSPGSPRSLYHKGEGGATEGRRVLARKWRFSAPLSPLQEGIGVDVDDEPDVALGLGDLAEPEPQISLEIGLAGGLDQEPVAMAPADDR